MFAFSLDRDGLNLAVQRAMQLHFDVADALHEQVTTGQQLVSVTVAGESDAIVATRRFEARKPWLLSSLDALKKRLECFL